MNRRQRPIDQIRIQVFDTLRNSALDARTFALNGQSVAKPSYSQNRFGFNAGGPLVIPKLPDISSKATFTVTYNGQIVRNPYDGTSTVPTAPERGGDFSRSRGTIYDPLSGGTQPFANNQIPLTRLDPVAMGLLAYIPVENQPGQIQNYRFVTAYPQNFQN
jgi:hypothetical protein